MKPLTLHAITAVLGLIALACPLVFTKQFPASSNTYGLIAIGGILLGVGMMGLFYIAHDPLVPLLRLFE